MREQVPYAKVISASYVYLNTKGFICKGKVKELQTQSRSQDSKIIAEHFSFDKDEK